MRHKDNSCLLSIDIGTTRTKAMLYCQDKGIVGEEEESYLTYYPRPGFVEQDPDEVFAIVLKITRRLIDNASIPPKMITAVIFDGIWHSLLPVDKEGNALYRAITWADMRSITQNEHLKASLNTEEVKQRTGCALHPMYFPSRLLWFRKKLPDVFKRTARFISIKEYIIHHLFGSYQVDHSTASGTGIWNMQNMNWDTDLLTEIGMTPDYFSECTEPVSFTPEGIKKKYASLIGLPEGTPGIIGASDGAFSHLGSAGVMGDKISLTVGTGAAVRKCVHLPGIIPGSTAWCYYLADGNWLQGGNMLSAGNALQWFADNLMPTAKTKAEIFSKMDQLAEEIPAGADGLFFLPFLGGQRCPADRPDARGTIYGLSLAHSRGHLIRAFMEGIAYNLYCIYKMLASQSKTDVIASGGVLNSPVWLKIISEFFGKTIWLPRIKEVAAWGGVILGLKAIGALSDLKDSINLIDLTDKQDPDPKNQKIYRNLLNEYEQLIRKIYG